MGGDPKNAPPYGAIDRGRNDIYIFIHNVYANFFKDSLDYFSLHIWPRFEHRVVATYDKAVEYLTKKLAECRELDKPLLPALILNPSGDFEWADAIASGHQLWRFPNLAPGMIKRIYDPVYQDEQVQVNVGFIRMQGDIELLMLLNSFYEYCDVRMMMIQIFGGFDRWIYPQFFNSFIILPEEIFNFQYTNPYTGVDYTLNWKKAGAYEHLVKTTARNEWVLPVTIKPLYKLSSLGDNSERYGGADRLADWRLTATIRYEIEIPSYFILESDYLVKSVDVEIRAGSAYTTYPQNEPPVPVNRFKSENDYEWGLDATTTTSIINLGGICEKGTSTELILNTRYFHFITAAEVDSTGNVVISIPEQIDDPIYLLVNSSYGLMNYGDHYVLANNGNALEIKTENVELEEGMVIELYVYKEA